MPAAGALTQRVRFQQRQPDRFGEPAGPWIDAFERAAGVQYLRGGEGVMAQRLQGVTPAIVTVYFDRQTRDVTNAWRIVDARSGVVMDIKAVNPDFGGRRGIDFLVEVGGSDGGEKVQT